MSLWSQHPAAPIHCPCHDSVFPNSMFTGTLQKTVTTNNENQPYVKMAVSCPTSFGMLPSTTPTAHSICYSLHGDSPVPRCLPRGRLLLRCLPGTPSPRAPVTSLFGYSYDNQQLPSTSRLLALKLKLDSLRTGSLSCSPTDLQGPTECPTQHTHTHTLLPLHSSMSVRALAPNPTGNLYYT